MNSREQEALTNVYIVASRLRQFPVPFSDHLALVGAVDECRRIFGAARRRLATARRCLPTRGVPSDLPRGPRRIPSSVDRSGWQGRLRQGSVANDR